VGVVADVRCSTGKRIRGDAAKEEPSEVGETMGTGTPGSTTPETTGAGTSMVPDSRRGDPVKGKKGEEDDDAKTGKMDSGG
jgi:hypothetical protein